MVGISKRLSDILKKSKNKKEGVTVLHVAWLTHVIMNFRKNSRINVIRFVDCLWSDKCTSRIFFHIAFHYFLMKVNLRHSYFSQCYPQSFDGWSWSYSLLLFHFNSSWSRNQKRWSISIEGDNFSTITHSCNHNYQYVNAISAYGKELRKGTVRSPLSLSS